MTKDHHNGTDRHEDRGQGEGHQQIGDQQQPSGGKNYREDEPTPPSTGSSSNDNHSDKGNDS